MGTWGTGISSNDTFADIYGDFFDLYNEKKSIKEISEKLIRDNQEIINIPEDANNFWFALALCQWECKELETVVYNRVENIIKSKKDLLVWEKSGASNSDLMKREKVLEKFLEKLKTERIKAKKIKPRVLKNSIFKKGDCLTYLMENGNFGGAFVLTDEENTDAGGNFIAITNINNEEKPSLDDFRKSKIYIRNQKSLYFKNNEPFGKWEEKPVIGLFMAIFFEKENIDIEVVGNLKIYKNYKRKNSFDGFSWSQLLKIIPEKEEYEKKNGIPKTKLKLSKWTKKYWL